MHCSTRTLGAPLLVLTLILAAPSPARADITAFLGISNRTMSTTTVPKPDTSHPVSGLSVGMGLIIVGFEVEYAGQKEDAVASVAGLRTLMGNVMLQTPTSGAQLYGTIGAGGYHETLNTVSQTDLTTNIGGGIKLSLVGPLRLRIDYRLIHLRGKTTDANVNRFYVGANFKF